MSEDFELLAELPMNYHLAAADKPRW